MSSPDTSRIPSPERGSKRKRPSQPRESSKRPKRANSGSPPISARGASQSAAPTPAARQGSQSTYISGAEDEDEDDLGELEAADADLERTQKLINEAIGVLYNQHFSEVQKDRFEKYRTAGFNKTAIKRLINHILDQSVPQGIVMAFGGVAKVFVGELIESARRIQKAAGREGPLTPDDVREAHLQWLAQRDAPGGREKRLFIR